MVTAGQGSESMKAYTVEEQRRMGAETEACKARVLAARLRCLARLAREKSKGEES